MKKLNKITALIICLVMLTGFVPAQVNSAPMFDYPIKVTQPDGRELNLFLSGDEFFNYAHDDDGYLIKQNGAGYYCYVEFNLAGRIVPSGTVVLQDTASNILGRVKVGEINFSANRHLMWQPWDDTVYPAIQAMTLNTESMILFRNERVRLTDIVSPENAAYYYSSWSSSDSAIARVDGYGLVKGIKKGEATITATTINGISSSCKVKVLSSSVPDDEYGYATMTDLPATPPPDICCINYTYDDNLLMYGCEVNEGKLGLEIKTSSEGNGTPDFSINLSQETILLPFDFTVESYNVKGKWVDVKAKKPFGVLLPKLLTKGWQSLEISNAPKGDGRVIKYPIPVEKAKKTPKYFVNYLERKDIPSQFGDYNGRWVLTNKKVSGLLEAGQQDFIVGGSQILIGKEERSEFPPGSTYKTFGTFVQWGDDFSNGNIKNGSDPANDDYGKHGDVKGVCIYPTYEYKGKPKTDNITYFFKAPPEANCDNSLHKENFDSGKDVKHLGCTISSYKAASKQKKLKVSGLLVAPKYKTGKIKPKENSLYFYDKEDLFNPLNPAGKANPVPANAILPDGSETNPLAVWFDATVKKPASEKQWLGGIPAKKPQSSPGQEITLSDGEIILRKDFDGILLTVIMEKASYLYNEPMLVTAMIKNNRTGSIDLRDSAIYPTKCFISFNNISKGEGITPTLIDVLSKQMGDMALASKKIAPGETYIQNSRLVIEYEYNELIRNSPAGVYTGKVGFRLGKDWVYHYLELELEITVPDADKWPVMLDDNRKISPDLQFAMTDKNHDEMIPVFMWLSGSVDMDDFAETYLANAEIVFQSKYTPVFICNLTAADIFALEGNDKVTSITPPIKPCAT